MKWLLTLACLLTFVASAFAGTKPARGRTIEQINVIPTRVLKRAISARFFETLRISPIDGHVVVRAELVGTKLFGARIAKSDLGGAFDAVALERAEELRLLRHYKLDRSGPELARAVAPVDLQDRGRHDGALIREPRERCDDQLDYFGCTKLKVLQRDGRWVEVKGSASLQDKGVMVRATGVKNNLEAIYIMERIPGGG